jgi:hypothetical protein
VHTQTAPPWGRDDGVSTVAERPIALTREEPAQLNQERLRRLFAELGPEAGEVVVTRALEELALRLARLGEAQAAGDHDALHKTARGMAAIADQLGMETLARAARDACACAAAGDAVALAAVLARLDRLGERSLFAVWDDRGPTG